MINLKNLIIAVLIPNFLGIIGNLLGNSAIGFDGIIKPIFVPPAIAFPIVWAILFTLMGVSSYIVFSSDNPNKKQALTIYGIQLVLNSLWTFFFFNLNWFFFSFILILVILFLVIIMTYKFYNINKVAGLLQIPYILWLIFASIITFNVFLLN